MIKQVLLVLTCCAIITVRSQQPCLGAPAHLPHSFAAASTHCSAYVICMGGQEIHGERCPDGMLFNAPDQTCGESTCMDCSPFGVQNLPHPTDCSRFVRCTMGVREDAECPNHLLFDRTIGNCNTPEDVYCPGQPGPTEAPTEPTDITTCPPDVPTEWPGNPTDPPIDPPTAPPTDAPPWPPIPTEPPGGDLPVCRGQVFHAHPTDCTRFFICIDEVLWEHSCRNELHWNQLINVCDLPEFARCLAQPGLPTDPPPPFPPDTEPPLWPPTNPPPEWRSENELEQITEN